MRDYRYLPLRISAAAALSCAVLVLLAPAASARKAPAGKACKGHRLGANSQLIVVGRKSKSYGNPYTDYYACARPHGRALRFAAAGGGDDEYGADAAVTPLQLAGPFAAVIQTTGLVGRAGCLKYGAQTCPAAPESLQVIDSRHRRVAKTSLMPMGNKLLALSATGAAAWSPAPDKLSASKFGGPAQAIALQGPIVPSSVRISAGDVLSWTETSGATRTAPLS